MKIKIESGIQFPRIGAPKPVEIPFGDLGVGDSFYVECGRLESINKMQWVRRQAGKYRKMVDRNYSIRISPDETGFRVWRTN